MFIKEWTNKEIIDTIIALGKKNEGVPREALWESPYLKGGRLLRTLVGRDESIKDFLKYVINMIITRDRNVPRFAILAGGSGTGKTRLVEAIMILVTYLVTGEKTYIQLTGERSENLSTKQ